MRFLANAIALLKKKEEKAGEKPMQLLKKALKEKNKVRFLWNDPLVRHADSRL